MAGEATLRVVVQFYDAAGAVVDSFIGLHDPTHHAAAYGTCRELRSFKALADSVEELEVTVTRVDDRKDDGLQADATAAVIAFRELHRLGVDDEDGELFGALDGAMYILGARHFRRAHAHW